MKRIRGRVAHRRRLKAKSHRDRSGQDLFGQVEGILRQGDSLQDRGGGVQGIDFAKISATQLVTAGPLRGAQVV